MSLVSRWMEIVNRSRAVLLAAGWVGLVAPACAVEPVESVDEARELAQEVVVASDLPGEPAPDPTDPAEPANPAEPVIVVEDGPVAAPEVPEMCPQLPDAAAIQALEAELTALAGKLADAQAAATAAAAEYNRQLQALQRNPGAVIWDRFYAAKEAMIRTRAAVERLKVQQSDELPARIALARNPCDAAARRRLTDATRRLAQLALSEAIEVRMNAGDKLARYTTARQNGAVSADELREVQQAYDAAVSAENVARAILAALGGVIATQP